jgi:tetratricopeptide (TPR) repeat protein
MGFKSFPEPGWYSLRGLSYSKLGDTAAALKDYKQAVTIRPTESAAWTNMANVYKENEDWGDAIEAYTHRIEIGGTSEHVARATLNRGYCLEQSDEKELALSDYIDACAMGNQLACGNQQMLEAAGVVASDATRAAAKASASSDLRSTKAGSGGGRMSGTAMGATVTTSAAGSVHAPKSMQVGGKEDL